MKNTVSLQRNNLSVTYTEPTIGIPLEESEGKTVRKGLKTLILQCLDTCHIPESERTQNLWEYVAEEVIKHMESILNGDQHFKNYQGYLTEKKSILASTPHPQLGNVPAEIALQILYPDSVTEVLEKITQQEVRDLWKEKVNTSSENIGKVVFLGQPGSGKTTVLAAELGVPAHIKFPCTLDMGHSTVGGTVAFVNPSATAWEGTVSFFSPTQLLEEVVKSFLSFFFQYEPQNKITTKKAISVFTQFPSMIFRLKYLLQTTKINPDSEDYNHMTEENIKIEIQDFWDDYKAYIHQDQYRGSLAPYLKENFAETKASFFASMGDEEPQEEHELLQQLKCTIITFAHLYYGKICGIRPTMVENMVSDFIPVEEWEKEQLVTEKYLAHLPVRERKSLLLTHYQVICQRVSGLFEELDHKIQNIQNSTVPSHSITCTVVSNGWVLPLTEAVAKLRDGNHPACPLRVDLTIYPKHERGSDAYGKERDNFFQLMSFFSRSGKGNTVVSSFMPMINGMWVSGHFESLSGATVLQPTLLFDLQGTSHNIQESGDFVFGQEEFKLFEEADLLVMVRKADPDGIEHFTKSVYDLISRSTYLDKTMFLVNRMNREDPSQARDDYEDLYEKVYGGLEQLGSKHGNEAFEKNSSRYYNILLGQTVYATCFVEEREEEHDYAPKKALEQIFSNLSMKQVSKNINHQVFLTSPQYNTQTLSQMFTSLTGTYQQVQCRKCNAAVWSTVKALTRRFAFNWTGRCFGEFQLEGDLMEALYIDLHNYFIRPTNLDELLENFYQVMLSGQVDQTLLEILKQKGCPLENLSQMSLSNLTADEKEQLDTAYYTLLSDLFQRTVGNSYASPQLTDCAFTVFYTEEMQEFWRNEYCRCGTGSGNLRKLNVSEKIRERTNDFVGKYRNNLQFIFTETDSGLTPSFVTGDPFAST